MVAILKQVLVRFLCILCVLFACTQAIQAAEDSYETLFYKIFKNKPIKELYSFDLNVVLDGADQNGTVKIYTSSFGDFYKVRAAAFLEALKEAQTDDGIRRVSVLVDEQGWVDLNELKALGFDYKLDRRNKGVSIETPVAYRKKIVIYVSPPLVNKKSGVLHQSSLSSYLNMAYLQTYYHDSSTQEFAPLNVNLTHVIFLNGWALKSVGNVEGGDAHPIAVDTSQVIYQDYNTRQQYAAGLLIPPVVGFLPATSLFGAGTSRIYSTWPDQVPVDNTPYQLELEHPSTVEIYRNKEKLSSYQLPSGPIEFRDFPLIYGNNEMRLRVIDMQTNAIRDIQFSLVYDNAMVPQNLSEFSLASGYVFTNDNRTVVVNGQEPVLTAFYKKSLSLDTQLTGYTDLRESQYMFGGESYHLLPIGRFRLGGAVLFVPGDQGFAASLTYAPFSSIFSGVNLSYQDAVFGESQSNVNAGQVRLGQGNTLYFGSVPLYITTFYAYDTKTSTDGYGGSLGTDYRLSNFSRATLQTYYQKIGSTSTYTLNSGWESRFVGNSLLNIYFRWATPSLHEAGTSSIVFSVNMPLDSNNNLTVREESSNTGLPVLGLDYRYDPHVDNVYAAIHTDNQGETTHVAGEISRQDFLSQTTARVNYGFTPTTRSQNQSLYYSTPRGRLTYNLDETKDVDDPSTLARTSSMTLETALVYADGQVAFSKPIYGSFAIVYPNESIQDASIVLKNNQAVIDQFGPAVVELVPYKTNTIEIGSNDVPRGFDIGQRKYVIETLPDSGVAIRIGTNRNVIITGKLINKISHAPISLRALLLTAADQVDFTPKWILTGEEGSFSERGLAPGTYSLELKGHDKAQFTIPDKYKGIWKLDDIEMSLKE